VKVGLAEGSRFDYHSLLWFDEPTGRGGSLEKSA
jgi:hypothetical protein